MHNNSLTLIEFIVVPDIKGKVADEVLDQLKIGFTEAIKNYVNSKMHTVYAPWEDEYRHINQRLVLMLET